MPFPPRDVRAQAFPLRKLSTVHLIDVYKRINRKYYNSRGGRRPSPGTTPPTPPRGGRFRSSNPAQAGTTGTAGAGLEADPTWRALASSAESRDILHDRYAVGRVIGKGSFARVVVGYDIVTDTRVALKVVKRSDAFHAQAAKELEILKALGGHGGGSFENNGGNNGMDNNGGSKGDGDGRRREGHPNVVSMLDAFVHRGGGGGGGPVDGGFHCLVFELLSHSLYDVLRSTSFKGVSLGLIRKFARQILSALSFLRSRGVVHCDLKPENVLLVSADRSAVKLIDFGSSCLVGDTPDFTYVQSRFYRAAEVILGLPYGSEIDSWSLGCILVEMHAGTPLFPGKDERDQLGKIAEALGPVPRWMRDRCPPEKRSMHYPHLVGAAQGEGGAGQGGAGGGGGRDVPVPGSRPLRGIIAAAARKFELSRHGERRGEDVGGGRTDLTGTDPAATLPFHALGIHHETAPPGGVGASYEDPGRGSAQPDGLSNVHDVVLFCDLVERIVTWNPEDRLHPDDALAHQFFGGGGGGGGGGSEPSSGGSRRRGSDAGFEMDFEMDLDDEAVARLGEFPTR